MLLRLENRIINTEHIAEVKFNPTKRPKATDYPGVLLISLAIPDESGHRVIRLEGKEAEAWWNRLCSEAEQIHIG